MRSLHPALGGSADLALRLVFFAAAPFVLVLAAALFPLTGALLQIGLALAVFFAGEAARRLAARSRLATFLLSTQLEFEAHYRKHPPRPFLYYVFYPLLFPYWLTVREARREAWLFKGYTIASFAILLGSLGFQYWRSFQPELTLRDFLPIAAATLAVETIAVFAFLMPIVTSVVHFHMARAPKRLACLLLVGLVSVAFAAVRLERRRDPVVSWATRSRVRLRSAARPESAQKAELDALRAAWTALPHPRRDAEPDGKVTGTPLDRAHAALAAFFRQDEAQAFDVWYARKNHRTMLVVYSELRRGEDPLWLAMDRKGRVTHVATELPDGAFEAMRRATR